ncbi:MAG: tRNA lysidine(34) synthetase TilS [Opitutales bacterium]
MSSQRNTLWGRRANALAAALPKSDLHPESVRLLDCSRSTWLIACSGGADSVALTLLLWAHWPRHRDRLHLVHVNHGLRGRAATADARFVQRLAKALAVPCTVRKLEPAPEGSSTETRLRSRRLAVFQQVGKAMRARYLLTGHHRDDRAETLLLRLARGSGSDGLAAPRPVHRHRDGLTCVRPLLTVGRGELQARLTRLRIPWREDNTNTDPGLTVRNRLRQEILPAWQAAEPERSLSRGLAASAHRLQADAEALDQWANQVLNDWGEPTPERALNRDSLAALPEAILRRVLPAWVRRVTGTVRSLPPAILDAWLQAVPAGDPGWTVLTLSPDWQLIRNPGRFRLDATTPAGPWPAGWAGTLEPDGRLVLPDGACLEAESVRLTAGCRCSIRSGAVDPRSSAWLAATALADGALQVRARLPGDRYRSLGAPGDRKLKNHLIDAKIPQRERDRLPVVLDKRDRILWVPGLPPVARGALQSRTRRAVRLTYRPPGTA